MAKKTVEEIVKLAKSYEGLVYQRDSLESKIKNKKKRLDIFEDTGNKWIIVKVNYGDGYDSFADDYIISTPIKEALIEDYQRYIERDVARLADINKQIEELKHQLEE